MTTHHPTVPDEKPQYVPVSIGRIEMARWGEDHWSTLAYLECRIVERHGKIDHNQMRCDRDRHPFMFSAKNAPLGLVGDRAYPTLLRNGTAATDDYDCIDDMITEGLVEVEMPSLRPGEVLTGLAEKRLMVNAVYRLTDRGRAIAGQLRAHKGTGGNFANFVPEEV